MQPARPSVQGSPWPRSSPISTSRARCEDLLCRAVSPTVAAGLCIAMEHAPSPASLFPAVPFLRAAACAATPEETVVTVISVPQAFNEDDLYVDLRSIFDDPLYLKCEGFNFAGSIKLKAATEMVGGRRAGRHPDPGL